MLKNQNMRVDIKVDEKGIAEITTLKKGDI